MPKLDAFVVQTKPVGRNKLGSGERVAIRVLDMRQAQLPEDSRAKIVRDFGVFDQFRQGPKSYYSLALTEAIRVASGLNFAARFKCFSISEAYLVIDTLTGEAYNPRELAPADFDAMVV